MLKKMISTRKCTLPSYFMNHHDSFLTLRAIDISMKEHLEIMNQAWDDFEKTFDQSDDRARDSGAFALLLNDEAARSNEAGKFYHGYDSYDLYESYNSYDAYIQSKFENSSMATIFSPVCTCRIVKNFQKSKTEFEKRPTV